MSEMTAVKKALVADALVSARNDCTDARLAFERKSWVEAFTMIDRARARLMDAKDEIETFLEDEDRKEEAP